ncbi:MAG: class I SAM-dependent methyltransferase [Planctomycetota bacterium]
MAKDKKARKGKKGGKSKKAQAAIPANRTAAGADKYELYGLSVQEPEHEVDFFDTVFNDLRGRKPLSLREDFCGTFAVCCKWVESHKKRTALGVDLDPEPVQWGKANKLAKLSDDEQSRVTLELADVRSTHDTKVDILAAQNFSFFVFYTRDELRTYFEHARSNLVEDGIMILDLMGGSECFDAPREDPRSIGSGKKKFRYVFELEKINPITHRCRYHISFHFKDGTSLDPCFSYDWRFWTLPEVQELLYEAGFSKVTVYWGEEDEDGEDTGEFIPAEDARPDPSWVCYIIAER